MDLALDLNRVSATFNDIKPVNGDLPLVTGQDAIKQHVLQRLRIFLGEWFLDQTKGIPFYNQILVKNPDQSKIDALIRNQIAQTPGIIQINSYSSKVDFFTRQLTIQFSAQSTKGIVDYASIINLGQSQQLNNS